MHEDARFRIDLTIAQLPDLDRTNYHCRIAHHLLSKVTTDPTRSRPAPQNKFAVRQVKRIESLYQIMKALPRLNQTDEADSELRFIKTRLRKFLNVNRWRDNYDTIRRKPALQKSLSRAFRHHTDQVRTLILLSNPLTQSRMNRRA